MYRGKLAIEWIIQHAHNASVPRARLPIQVDTTHGIPFLRTTLFRSAQEFRNVNGVASVYSSSQASTSVFSSLTHSFWQEHRSTAFVSQRSAYSSDYFKRSELVPWPYKECVDILLTTRSQELAEYYETPIKVDSFTMEEARGYLQKALSLTEAQLADAGALAEAVGCYPLSLFYLAGYIKSEAITLEECLRRYEKEKFNFLKMVALSHVTPEQGVAAFMLFRKIQEQSPLVAQLLQVCAFLSADSISLDWLQDYFSTQSREEVTSAWKRLRHVFFVNSQPGYLSMHRLLQEIVRFNIAEDIIRYQNLVSKLLTFFEEKVKNFKNILSLTLKAEREKEVIREQFTHVKAFCFHITQTKVELTPEIQAMLVNLLVRSGDYCYQEGNYREAQYYLKQALSIEKQSLGEEHSNVAISLNNVGGTYAAQGDYPKAIHHYEQALSIWKKSLGEEHPAVATSLNNLGAVYASQGDYPKAIPYHKQALVIRKKSFGEEHPSVATSLNNLGAIYANQGNYPKAICHYEQALQIYKMMSQPNQEDIETVEKLLADCKERLKPYRGFRCSVV